MVPRAVEQHELLGIPDRQRAQEHFVDEREDRRIGADAERDRQEGDHREQRRTAEPAPRVPAVPSEMTIRRLRRNAAPRG